MTNTENTNKFVKWAFETAIVEGMELDAGDVQEKLLECDLIESRPVNPDENEWDADYLFFLKEPKPVGNGGCRAEFEKWYQIRWQTMPLKYYDEFNEYHKVHTQNQWEAWQAAHKTPKPAPKEIEPKSNDVAELVKLLINEFETELQYLITTRTALNWLHDLKEPTRSHNMKFALEGIDKAVNRTVLIEDLLNDCKTFLTTQPKGIEELKAELEREKSMNRVLWHSIRELKGVPQDLPVGETFTDKDGVVWVNHSEALNPIVNDKGE